MADDEGAKAGDASAREFARLWRVWRTVHEMLADRGYIISDEELQIGFDDFKTKVMGADGLPDRRPMKFSAWPSDDMIRKYTTSESEAPDIGSIWVEFSPDTSIGIKQMRNFVQYLSQHSYHTGILVTSVNVTAAALKIIPAVQSETRIECFLEQDLLVNITHHELVPKHVLLSKEEKTKLLQRYRLKETQLPRIQVGDPVARYLGLRRGQVVKIIRKSETAGRYASYRTCI